MIRAYAEPSVGLRLLGGETKSEAGQVGKADRIG
jgi:hypothetical protein